LGGGYSAGCVFDLPEDGSTRLRVPGSVLLLDGEPAAHEGVEPAAPPGRLPSRSRRSGDQHAHAVYDDGRGLSFLPAAGDDGGELADAGHVDVAQRRLKLATSRWWLGRDDDLTPGRPPRALC
jgi:hypothetical protein